MKDIAEPLPHSSDVRACAGVLLVSFQGILFAHLCAPCHAREVAGYQRNATSRSLRTAMGEPDGEYDRIKSNTRFLVRSSRTAVYQRMEHDGQNSDCRIDYVIGSGAHASCYLARVGDHLFQSPICLYPDRGYGMAPGYEENPAPGFTRPVTVECLLCHSGRPLPMPETLNGTGPRRFPMKRSRAIVAMATQPPISSAPFPVLS